MLKRINARDARIGVVALSLCAFALTASSSSHAQIFRSIDYSGEELYQRFCSACHGPAARGDGPVAATLSVNVPDLTRLAERRDNRFPIAEIQETIDGRSLVIAHGTRTMPVWGYEFWVEEGADINAEANARDIIGRLVDYLESIQVRAPGPADADR